MEGLSNYREIYRIKYKRICGRNGRQRRENCLRNVIADVITFDRGDDMIFSEAVKKVREIKGYSQEQLARELNVSFATINRWENGKTEPSRLALTNFMKFCKQHDVDVLEGDVK